MERNFNELKWKKHGDDRFISLDIGESVVGTYVGKEESQEFKGTFNYQIDIEGKGVIKLLSGTVISSHLDKIPIGSALKVVYKGKPKGKNYNDYDVFVGE